MKTLSKPISLIELKEIANHLFGNLVKAVVDVKKEIIAIDAELHADEEALLIQNGSRQENLWGINLYPDLTGDDFIEFDSMINLRPSAGNNTRGVDNPKIRERIAKIVHKFIKK